MKARAGLPGLRDETQRFQNRNLAALAAARDAAEEIEATKSAAGMSPELCAERLRRVGISIRLDEDGKLQAAPANRIGKRIRALLRVHEPGLTAILREQENFARI
jgi:hypothetical protein